MSPVVETIFFGIVVTAFIITIYPLITAIARGKNPEPKPPESKKPPKISFRIYTFVAFIIGIIAAIIYYSSNFG